MRERTLCLIKPDAVSKRVIGKILSAIEESGFEIEDMKLVRWTREEAEGFYHVHKGKPFFEGLIKFMTSGPIVAILLERENAIKTLRKLVGPTDPIEAPPCTIRALYGTNVRRNAVHASDSPESAMFEIQYIFGEGKHIVKD